MTVGEYIMQGFIDGITSRHPRVEATLHQVTNEIPRRPRLKTSTIIALISAGFFLGGFAADMTLAAIGVR